MSISMLRATGRLLLPVTAAVLLAGVSLEAGAVDYGKIALSVPNDYTTAEFVYERGTSTLATQNLVMDSRGCTFSTTGTLVGLTPGPASNKIGLGMGPTSIGVYDGPTGVPCYRVSYAGKLGQESLKLTLNSNLPKFTVTDADGNDTDYKANGFDRLELDIEAKGDLLLKLTIELRANGSLLSTRTYELRTGAQINGPIADSDFESDPSHRVFNCSSRSDSGNDSGSNDNCRWIINDWGNSFTMTPESGEFSLEGGGDLPALVTDPRTLIHLTDIQSGFANCGTPVTATGFDNAQFCSVTLKQFGTNTSCSNVPYALLYGGDSCEFITPVGTQVVANAIVAYEPEDQVDPGTGDAWTSSPLSRITFAKVDGSFPIPPCLGLTLTDYMNPAPIAEVGLGGPNNNGVDGPYDWAKSTAYPGNNTIEFACAYFRSENYVKPEGSTTGKTYIEEWVQFWSDPQLSRPGGGFSN